MSASWVDTPASLHGEAVIGLRTDIAGSCVEKRCPQTTGRRRSQGSVIDANRQDVGDLSINKERICALCLMDTTNQLTRSSAVALLFFSGQEDESAWHWLRVILNHRAQTAPRHSAPLVRAAEGVRPSSAEPPPANVQRA